MKRYFAIFRSGMGRKLYQGAPSLVGAFFLAFGWLSTVQAQPPAADTQVRSQELQRQANPQLRSPKSQFGEDEEEDFGKLAVLKRPSPWYVTPFVSASGFWTSNVLLSNAGEKGDTVFVETQGFDAGYRINSDWQIQAGYSYQLTRYSENPVLDTDAHAAGFSTSYQLPWNWQISAGERGLWLKSPDQKVEVYRENSPFVGVSQSWGFLDGRLSWVYGYEYDHKYANPVGFERDEHTVYTGVSYGWLSTLASQLVLRQNWQFYDYRPPEEPVNGRQEWVSSVILQTVWQPLNWLQVRGFGTTTYDNSVNSTRDYKVANAGGEIRLFWKF